MSEQTKQKEKSKFFSFYEKSILVFCFIAIAFFIVWILLKSFPDLFKEEWMVSLKEITHVLLQMVIYVLGLFCVVHLLVLLLRCLTSNNSFIWLIGQQIIPLAFPLIVILSIKLFSGQFDDKLSDVVVGVFSGIISSIVVLILNRNEHLADTVLRNIAWEYLNSNNVTGLESTATSDSAPAPAPALAPAPKNNQRNSNNPKRKRKRKK